MRLPYEWRGSNYRFSEFLDIRDCRTEEHWAGEKMMASGSDFRAVDSRQFERRD
jgi:hypothetical protein